MDAKLLMMAAAGVGGDFYPYTVDNSCRFYGNDKLTWSPSSGGNRKTFTISLWAKPAMDGTDSVFFNVDGSGTGDSFGVYHQSGGGFYAFGYSAALSYYQRQQIDQLYRDPSAWYHWVFAYDTTASTVADRFKIYVNGVDLDQSNWTADTLLALNVDTGWNESGRPIEIGEYADDSSATDTHMYMAQFAAVDGQQLAASDFGEDKNGVWVPKDLSGLTWGGNGFWLDFADSSALGNDVSGNNNDFTSSGLAASDQMTDTPINNFCTWTPLKNRSPTLKAVLSEGNLAALFDNGTYLEYSWGTMALPAEGKWYWEYKCTAVGSESSYGISGINVPEGNPDVARTYRDNGKKYLNMGSATAYGDTFTTNDVIGVAVDMDGGNLYFYKNNTIQASGTAAYTDLLTALPDGGWTPLGAGYNNASVLANFGQTAFAYTPPTGYVALNTANLPEPTIGPNSTTLTSEVFAPILYTGNGTAIGSGGKTISSLAFQPDFTWIKNRDAADSHMLFDAVRGVTKYLESDTADAEATDTESLTSFTATGFTLGNNVAVNTNTEDYVAWNWKANGSGAANEDGSINTTKTSVNTDAGVSILQYTGNATSGATVGHGLGAVPKFAIFKMLSQNAAAGYDVYVYHASLGQSTKLKLNTNGAESASTDWPTLATTSLFYLGGGGANNGSGLVYAAYLFAEVEGFSSFGSYTGNGNADGPFVYCGFSPAYVMVKSVSTTHSWWITDTVRNTSNVIGDYLYANIADAEYNAVQMDALSNGFKLRTTGTTLNSSGNEFIYMAFAENPFKYSNAR